MHGMKCQLSAHGEIASDLQAKQMTIVSAEPVMSALPEIGIGCRFHDQRPLHRIQTPAFRRIYPTQTRIQSGPNELLVEKPGVHSMLDLAFARVRGDKCYHGPTFQFKSGVDSNSDCGVL